MNTSEARERGNLYSPRPRNAKESLTLVGWRIWGDTMSEAAEPVVRVPTGLGKPDLVLATAEDVASFVARELNFWKILVRPEAGGVSSILDFPNSAYTRLNALATIAAQYASDNVSFLSALRRSFQKLYQESSNQLPTSTSPDGQLLKNLKEQLSDLGFSVAVQFVMRRGVVDGLSLSHPDHLMAVVAVTSFRLGLSGEGVRAHEAAFNTLTASFGDAAASEVNKHREITATLDRTGNELLTKFGNDRVASEQRALEALESHKKDHESAVASFKAVETAFKEQLQLAAPTVYWTSKRERHRLLAAILGAWCAIFGIIAAITISSGLNSEFERAVLLDPATNWVPYVLLGARGLFVSVIIFWAGRIFVRMFLSQLHLAMDAHERSTMVMTYLALTQEGKITPEERPLVLQPLFRPSSDGIVKDDGSSDPVVSAIVARALPRVG